MRKSAAAFVLMMLAMSLFPWLTPEVKAVSTQITLLDPTSGYVGTLVKVEGTLNTTNGFYIIRWNQTLNITMGYATEYNVSTSFIVPPTVGAPSGLDIFVELIDNSTQTIGTKNFTLFTQFHIRADKPSLPRQLQEGQTTKIWVNVTGGEANTVYAANISVSDPSGKNFPKLVSLSNTTTAGYGEGNVTYPNDFGTKAHTNNTGTYHVFFNKTLAADNFTIGLTDKLEYRLDETVQVLATGYGSLELVIADLEVGELSIDTFPKEFTASAGGVITFSWKIPLGAKLGIYNLTLTSVTSPGTVKTPPDTQNFEVLGFTCQIQTLNLADQPVADVIVEVYDAATGADLNVPRLTNSSGWVQFTLNIGNYTFKAFLKGIEVGVLSNVSVSQNVVLPPLKLQLTNMRIIVQDKARNRLPFIDLKLNITLYEAESFRTNTTGTWEIYNLFTNINYVVEAKRYNLTLPETPIQNRTLPIRWNNITITVPSYTMFVQVLDSKDAPAAGLKVVAHEWSSGIGEPSQPPVTTDANGNASFELTFGRYRLRMYSANTFLNEVTVDLIRNQSSFTIRSNVYNVDLNVLVVDYFGQPIPNVSVELQRKGNSDYETTQTKTTSSNGVASFNGIIGGDSRVSVSVAGRPGETQYLYLVGPTKDVVFKIDRYVVVAGYVLETSQFVTMVILLVIIVAFIVASTYKRIPRLLQRRKK